jgi:AcrR family transcriptional regulator
LDGAKLSDSGATEAAVDTRTRILEAARKVLAERGYDGATMRAISAEAGVAVGLANYHFRSRRQLLVEVIATSREHFLGEFDARLPEAAGPQAVRRMAEVGAGLLDLMPEWYSLFADLDARGLRDDELARVAAANKRDGHEDMRRSLEYACERLGKEPPADLDGIAAVVLAVHEGAGVRALLDPDFDPIIAHRALERMVLAVVAPEARAVDAGWDRDPFAEVDPTGDRLRGSVRR